MKYTEDREFLQLLKHHEESFSGWDFSFISDTGRVASEPLDWSYVSKAMTFIHTSKAMLDMGTGGGELLSRLRPFPEIVYATEAYAPNIPVAKERLEPLGVRVMAIDDDNSLPFDDAGFDLVLNKHESFSPAEVRRILRPSGTFLTQQVGGLDCVGINDRMEAPYSEYADWSLSQAITDLESNGFEIVEQREQFPIQRFYDIGALVYYLKAIEWQIADFQPEGYMEQLYGLHLDIQRDGYWDVKQHRFLIHARAV
ncbi:SAM-dependent methyltransferase [Paenibacillus terrae HPL-003]|uniref:SAM-dependent methyltransferase n=1 Tax=Paenibacillus terrae (strain HPL-003) TaxID=985665 RepID=G7VXF4_PAETH|nr:class I SAM-dependent methyltransferase [Paenibacillus terrae]AET59396.1 SAM-dependent methyltransferase [Paenibacillus terrae HPL-003]